MEVAEDPASLRSFACELARLGGRTAARLFGKVTVSRKADNSPVTEADHITQDAILRALSEKYPSHAILVEETVRNPDRHAAFGSSEYCWIIDPIDGTRNFGKGVRVYATSVAVMHRGRPVAGAVHDATNDVIYSAATGHGAFRDESRISMVESPITRDTIVAVGSFRRHPMPHAVRGWMDQYLVRNLGSTALHLAWVGAGLIDAAYSNECKLWDVAAASVVIEEAGCVFTSETGRSLWPCDLHALAGEDMQVLAGTKGVHKVLLTSLR